MKRSLVILFCLLLFRHLYGQGYLPLEHLSAKDGLSYREVNQVYQDSVGFMWIATARGLNRYDGVEWLVYKHSDRDSTSIPNSHVTWVMDDGTGNLLMGLKGGSICFYNRQTGAFKPARWLYQGKDVDFVALQPFQTSGGHFQMPVLSLDTEENFLLDYLGNGQFGHAVSIQRLSEAFFTSRVFPARLLGGKAKHYWYWRAGQYYCFQLSDYRFARYSPKSSISGQFMFPAMQPAPGKLLDSFALPASVSKSGLRDFTFDNHRNVWLRDKQNRVFKYDVQQKHLAEAGEFDLDQTPLGCKIFEDKEGVIWIPHKFGIVKIKQRRRYFENYLNARDQWEAMPEKGRETYAMAEDRLGNILVFAKGLFFIDKKTKNVDQVSWRYSAAPKGAMAEFPGIPWSSNHLKMLAGTDGLIWMNTGYLIRLNPGSKTLSAFNYAGGDKLTSIRKTLAEDDKGRLWLSKGKLFSFDQATGEFRSQPQWQQQEFTNLLQADGEYIWATTTSGLVRIHTQTNAIEKFKVFSDNKLKMPHLIFKILPYKGLIWMGTNNEDLGLIKFNPQTRELTRFTTENGLSHNIIYTILPDGNNLWLGTHNGLCKFNIQTGNTRNYYTEDGLTHNEFNREAAVKTSAGKMFFGGMNGLNAFFPRVLDSLTAMESSRLVWTRFSKIDGNTDTVRSFPTHLFEARAPLEIQHQDRSLIFQYALLSFSDPTQNKYYHLLEGFDKSWNYAGNIPIVNYPSLPPGQYTLRVKSKDSHGNPGVNELSIPIVVIGPWWNTWWAYCLFGITFIVLFLGIRKYELRRLFAQGEALRLKELNTAKAKFYTNITHEFRTPLTVIMGLVQNISGWENEQKLILRNSQNLLHLVNQMLDLSKLESGSMRLNMQQADIIGYLRYLTESFYSLAKEKGIRLVSYSEEPELVVDFDEEKLQHVVYNLLSNALKFTPADSGAKVVLHVRKLEGENLSQVQIKIQDTGKGISEEQLPHIFDRFYQADDSHTRSGGGTGIGLTLTKEFVELMGGSISANSMAGEGSTFTVLLPIKNDAPLGRSNLVEKEASDENEKESGVQPETTDFGLARLNKPISGDKPLLLIVEDNNDVASYIQSIVKKEYQIELAPNGKVGLEMVLQLIPDIIISDVMMPEMDGYTLAQTLKTDERTSHIPIILLTAKAEQQDRLTGLQTGADAYLIKPFNKAELLLRLEKLTELRHRLQQRYAGLDPEDHDTKSQSPEDIFLQKLIRIVEEHLDKPEFTTAGLCKAALLSQPQLYRKLMALTGKSPTVFIRTIRLRKAAKLLRSTEKSISEIAWATGFSDPSYFSRVFNQEFGETPGKWRN